MFYLIYARTWTATGRTGCQPRKPKALVLQGESSQEAILSANARMQGGQREMGRQSWPVVSGRPGSVASRHLESPMLLVLQAEPTSEGLPATGEALSEGGSGKGDAAAQLCSYQQALGQNVLHQFEVVAKLLVLAAGPLHLLVGVEAEVLRLILELALLQHCKPTDTQARGQAPTGRSEAAPGIAWFGRHRVLFNGITCQH